MYFLMAIAATIGLAAPQSYCTYRANYAHTKIRDASNGPKSLLPALMSFLPLSFRGF